MFGHPLGRGALLGQWALHVLFLGAYWVWDQGTIPGGFCHSPAFADAHRELVAATYSQQQVCVFSFSLFASLSPLGFELELEMPFLALWHCTCHSRNVHKRSSFGNGKK